MLQRERESEREASVQPAERTDAAPAVSLQSFIRLENFLFLSKSCSSSSSSWCLSFCTQIITFTLTDRFVSGLHDDCDCCAQQGGDPLTRYIHSHNNTLCGSDDVLLGLFTLVLL